LKHPTHPNATRKIAAKILMHSNQFKIFVLSPNTHIPSNINIVTMIHPDRRAVVIEAINRRGAVGRNAVQTLLLLQRRRKSATPAPG